MSSTTAFNTDVTSVTDAAGRGVPGLVREAEEGHDIVVARRGRPVAAVISIGRLEKLRDLGADLRSAALVSSRSRSDDGARHQLDDVIDSFGSDRTELEADLAADLAADRRSATRFQLLRMGLSSAVTGRASSRQPETVRTVVRLTTDAVADLDRLLSRRDPQVVRWAFKKMIHLEQNPEAGDALLGGLMGWRKITVGDRDWRLVWRVTHDVADAIIVDVAEIWAFGARTDAEVYEEMQGRIASAPQTPQTKALADVLLTLGKLTDDLEAAHEPLPKWLRESLQHVVRLPANQVNDLTREEADQLWRNYITGQKR